MAVLPKYFTLCRALTLVALLSLTSCGYTQLYSGPRLERENTARVEISFEEVEGQFFVDGREQEWYNSGVEVLPGKHSISGTINTYKNKKCGPVVRRCRQVRIDDYDRRGRRRGWYYQTRCECSRNCVDDAYRAVCVIPFDVGAGESRDFVVRSSERTDAKNDGEPRTVMTLSLSEDGREIISVECDDNQYAGPNESTESVGCW